MGRSSRIITTIVVCALAVPVVLVAWVLFHLYVYDPLLYRAELFIAEGTNDQTYEMGSARIVRIRFRAIADGREVSTVRKIICIPKRSVSSPGLKGGPHVFDLSTQIGADHAALPLDGGRELTVELNQSRCGFIVDAYEAGRKDYFAPYVVARISRGQENFACTIIFNSDDAEVGHLKVFEPEVIGITEMPIRTLLTRDEYGPANRRGFNLGLDRARTSHARLTPGSDTYYWKPEAKCWESSKALSHMRRDARAGYHSDGVSVCSTRGRLLCGFGS